MQKRNYSKQLIISIMLLLLAPAILFAERIYLDPSNLQEVSDKVFYLHKDEITLPLSKVNDFLSTNIAGDYRAEYDAPVPKIKRVESHEMDIIWNNNSNAQNYVIRYLNLTDASVNTFTTTSNGITLVIPNGMYLLTFQIQDDQGSFSKSRVMAHSKGANFIIIEDKPLSSFLNEDCECEFPVGEQITETVTGEEATFLPAPLENSDNFYFVNITSVDANNTTHQSKYYFRYITSAGNPDDVHIYGEYDLIENYLCINNMDMMELEQSNVYSLNIDYYQADLPFRNIRFGFDGGLEAICIEPQLYISNTLTIQKCALSKQEERFGQEESKSISVKIYPNPTQDFINLDFEASKNIPSNIQIINNYGQIMREFSGFQVKVQVNIEDLPAGIYYVKTIAKNKSTTSTFVKM